MHSSPTCKMEALLQTRAYFLHKLTRATEELWTRAVDEQKRLTIQLARNSFYFTISHMLIRFFGDQLKQMQQQQQHASARGAAIYVR